MYQKLLQYILTYLLDKLISLITGKWDEYQEDQDKDNKKKDELKIKVKAIKNAKTKEDFRTAIRDLSI